eukprot:6190589-Pleurochrysis_carterae.AAC.1
MHALKRAAHHYPSIIHIGGAVMSTWLRTCERACMRPVVRLHEHAFKKCALQGNWRRTFAMSVLPLPGGPKSNAPEGGDMPIKQKNTRSTTLRRSFGSRSDRRHAVGACGSVHTRRKAALAFAPALRAHTHACAQAQDGAFCLSAACSDACTRVRACRVCERSICLHLPASARICPHLHAFAPNWAHPRAPVAEPKRATSLRARVVRLHAALRGACSEVSHQNLTLQSVSLRRQSCNHST